MIFFYHLPTRLWKSHFKKNFLFNKLYSKLFELMINCTFNFLFKILCPIKAPQFSAKITTINYYKTFFTKFFFLWLGVCCNKLNIWIRSLMNKKVLIKSHQEEKSWSCWKYAQPPGFFPLHKLINGAHFMLHSKPDKIGTFAVLSFNLFFKPVTNWAKAATDTRAVKLSAVRLF